MNATCWVLQINEFYCENSINHVILGVWQVGMVEYVGLLKVKVIEARSLVVKDMKSSDPYVVATIGQQVSRCSEIQLYG